MKRTICIILATLVLMLSVFTFGASAEEKTSTDFIYFQVPYETGVAWNNFSMVFCHIWSEGNDGGDFYAWQSKNERCTDLGNGYWSYDISGFEFKEDSSYSLIFSNENGLQTYNLNFTSACRGDIVTCNGDTCVNPVDSEKQCTVARWITNADSVHPAAQISSDGAVVDPDGVFNDDVDRKWGNAEGVSVEFPEVEVPTEAETEAPTEAELADTTTQDGKINYSIWFIIGGAVLGAIIATVVVLAKKKK